jgi:Cu2+-exporting ATPase
MQLVPPTELKQPATGNASTTAPATETITLDVQGMKCAGCVRTVEQQLKQHPGVVSACVNLVTEVAVVECEAGTVAPDALAQKLTPLGFTTKARSAGVGGEINAASDLDERHRQEMHSALWQLVTATVLLILSGVGHVSQWGGPTLPILSNIWFHCGLATATLLLPAREILLDGWRGLRHSAPNMNTLVGLGAVTAYTASLVALVFPQLGWECFFDEPVMLLGFILLGRTLEKQARGRAAAAFRNLLALQPQFARLIANPEKVATSENSSVEIPADHVRVGEWLQVLPGEKIPVDGEVVAGQTTVDESMLTGESMPVMKQPGDPVTAGTLTQSGAIAIRATRTGKDTTLSQIVTLVEAAQTRKAPVQRLADTVAGYFTYGVLVAAALTFIFWYFIGTHIWSDVLTVGHWHSSQHLTLHTQHLAHTTHTLQPSPLLLSLKLAIAVMVVACPCALGLATPTAILVGTGLAAERGLLIKGGDVLERVHHLDTVVFDKTGTLTTGHPTVTDCIPVSNGEMGRGGIRGPHEVEIRGDGEMRRISLPHSLLQLAAAAESGTCHPLAVAIRQEAQRQGLSIPTAGEFYTEPGLGVSALVAGERVLLGNSDWLSAQGILLGETVKLQAQALAAAGKTVVYVAVGGQLAGLIAVMDTLRPDAKIAVDSLRQMGLRVMLLTGDKPEAANAIAQKLGIEQIFAEVRPAQKAAIIQSLQIASTREPGDKETRKASRQGEKSPSTTNHRLQALPPCDDGKQLLQAPLTTSHSVVAMVGDGINDAPALAQSDVGIALQAGTDVAMETAQIVLMRAQLTDVVEAIQLSRATFNKIRQNLFWAFAYNICGIPIAAGVLLPISGFVLSPAAAGALMAFSSVSVVTNSLLLRRLKNRLYANQSRLN